MKENIDGILLINKPSGITSHDVVNFVRKIFNMKKVGHTGTLDPLASGLLVVLLGKCTKLSDKIISVTKEYEVKVKIGVKTDTLDITGKIEEEKSIELNKENLKKDILSFIGKYNQEVPIYSSVKINGKKLYEYARKNENIELPTREVDILDINDIKIEDDSFSFFTKVSKGTYIRSLVRDICNKNNILGTVESLKRISQGDFTIEDSFTLEEIKEDKYKIITIEELFDKYPKINVSEEEYKKVQNGNKLEKESDKKYYRLFYNNKLIAIYENYNSKLKPLINMTEEHNGK